MKKQRTVPTKLKCTECGLIMPIARKASKKRGIGHTKHMYCVQCKATQAFTEMQQLDDKVDFWNEWHDKV